MTKLSKSIFFYIAALAAFCMSADRVGAQQQRGPSTPEERTRAVQIAKSLRADPTSPEIQQDREWLIKWLIQVPDISVKLCSGLLGDLGDSKTGYPGALLATMMSSQAAYVIENPARAKDNNAAYLAGVDGALDAYQAIRAKDSSFRLPQLDDLIQKRSDGKLSDYIRSAAKKCK